MDALILSMSVPWEQMRFSTSILISFILEQLYTATDSSFFLTSLFCSCSVSSILLRLNSSSSLWMTMILLSTLVRSPDSQEYILLMRLEKYVAVLSYMFLKKRMDAKSSSKSSILSCGSSLCSILMMRCLSVFFISSARWMMVSLSAMMPVMFLPSDCTLLLQSRTISLHILQILMLLLLVISSMQSLMASLADQERMFWMCLLFTYWHSLMVLRMLFQLRVGLNALSLSSLLACRKRRMRFLNIRNQRNFLQSSLKREMFCCFMLIICLISLWQSQRVRSGAALLTMMQTPSCISVRPWKAVWRLRMSLGSLSARGQLMWDQSMMRVILTLSQMSRRRWTKKELDISNSYPLLSRKPGQSQNAILSMTTLVGMDVSEYFLWPILMRLLLSLSRVALSPQCLITSCAPARKDMMVDLPTPVSPITITAELLTVSLGSAVSPFFMSSFSRTRSNGLFSWGLIQIILQQYVQYHSLSTMISSVLTSVLSSELLLVPSLQNISMTRVSTICRILMCLSTHPQRSMRVRLPSTMKPMTKPANTPSPLCGNMYTDRMRVVRRMISMPNMPTVQRVQRGV